MKTAIFNLSDKQHVMFQLRILKPLATPKVLETLYYIWRFPEEYGNKLVEAKLYKNLHSVKVTLLNLEDMGLLEKIGPRPGKTILTKELSSQLFDEDITYIVKK